MADLIYLVSEALRTSYNYIKTSRAITANIELPFDYFTFLKFLYYFIKVARMSLRYLTAKLAQQVS